MNNNILLGSAGAVFEPHVYPDKDLPFIYHVDRALHTCIANLHENPEFLYFTKGTARVRCGNEIYSVSPGDFLAVDSYQVHQVMPEGEVVYVCLIPSCDFCKTNGLDVARRAFTPLLRDEGVISRFFRVMEEYASPAEFQSAAIRCAVLDLVTHLCRYHSQPRHRPALLRDASFEYVRRSIEFMKLRYRERLTVEQIASAAGLSKYHFLRQFKRITGHTVVDYLNSVRCEYAKQLLIEGKCNVKQAALECGFENVSYFTNVFRRYAGCLPSECIKR